jgi:hypothetical protein
VIGLVSVPALDNTLGRRFVKNFDCFLEVVVHDAVEDHAVTFAVTTEGCKPETSPPEHEETRRFQRVSRSG